MIYSFKSWQLTTTTIHPPTPTQVQTNHSLPIVNSQPCLNMCCERDNFKDRTTQVKVGNIFCVEMNKLAKRNLEQKLFFLTNFNLGTDLSKWDTVKIEALPATLGSYPLDIVGVWVGVGGNGRFTPCRQTVWLRRAWFCFLDWNGDGNYGLLDDFWILDTFYFNITVVCVSSKWERSVWKILDSVSTERLDG